MIVVVTISPQPSYASSDIQATLHILSLTPHDDQWYMNTKATCHMSENGCNLTSYFNINNNIIFGSGHNILVISYGNALVPNPNHYLTLNNILHAPKLIKNLVL